VVKVGFAQLKVRSDAVKVGFFRLKVRSGDLKVGFAGAKSCLYPQNTCNYEPKRRGKLVW